MSTTILELLVYNIEHGKPEWTNSNYFDPSKMSLIFDEVNFPLKYVIQEYDKYECYYEIIKLLGTHKCLWLI